MRPEKIIHPYTCSQKRGADFSMEPRADGRYNLRRKNGEFVEVVDNSVDAQECVRNLLRDSIYIHVTVTEEEQP